MTAGDGKAASVAIPVELGHGRHRENRFGWLILLFAAWIFFGLLFWVLSAGRSPGQDLVISPAHIPFYLGIVGLVAFLGAGAFREVRAGRSWRGALPSGYGTVGAGAVLLVIWPIVEVGWREGVGLRFPSIEQILAPSRIILPIAIAMIAVAPLRAELRSGARPPARWLATLSAALVLTVSAGPGGLGPAESQRLEAVPNGPENDGEIWVMNADGTHQTRLIEASGGYDLGNAVWSPDGTQLAYTRWTAPPRLTPAEDADIWIADADGTNQHLLVEGAGWQWIPHWSPDGEWLTYTVDGPGGPGGGAGVSAPIFGWLQGPAAGQPPSVAPDVDVWRIRADGTGAPERLTDSPADDRAGVYAPDGKHFLFDSTREEGHTGIYVADVADGTVARATFFGDDWGGTWSPDGTHIAFNSSNRGPEDVFVVAFPASGPPNRLTDDPAGDFTPCFSPDGSRIAFASERGDEQEIWSIAADGTDPRNLSRTTDAGEFLAPGGGCWGLDGRIVYARVGDLGPSASPLVREDLGAAGTLLQALLLSVLVLAVIRIGAPFGAVAILLGSSTAIWEVLSEQWQYVPLAIVFGLLVDVLVRLASDRLKGGVAGAGAGAALVLAAGATAVATVGLGWSPTLLLGVALASAALGWGLSGLIAPYTGGAVPVPDE